MTGKPTIPAAQVQADWNAASGLGAILNKPALGTAAAQNVGAFATAAQGYKADTAVQPAALNGKQDKLTGTSAQINLGNGAASDSIPVAVLGLTYNSTSEISVTVTPPMWMYVTDGTNYGLKQIQNLPISKGQVGLGEVDNTSDVHKPISSATQEALDGKASGAQGTKADTAVQPATLSGYYTKVEIDQMLAGFVKKANPQFTGTVRVDGNLISTGDIEANAP